MQIIIAIAVLIIAITLILYKVNNQFEKKRVYNPFTNYHNN